MPTSSSEQTVRIIDASLNRVGEGLRVLEEIARLFLDDATLTQQLKTLRHELLRGDRAFQQRLIRARNPEADVGADMEVPGEEKGRDWPMVLVANARRVQEALRTLEELAKVPDAPVKLEAVKFQRARFTLYTIEQELMSRLLRRDKRNRVSGLYVIIDSPLPEGCEPAEVARQAIRGGARLIQLRDKSQSRKKVLSLAGELKTLCAEHDVLFIVNDYLDVALAVEADGLHVGQDDLPAPVARRLLPPDKILGVSATNVDEAAAAQSAGADYIAVGAIYPTLSKETVVVGLEALRQVRQAVDLPLVAIGGITKDNVAEVMAAGADSVAVISAVAGAKSPEKACWQIVEIIEVKR